MAVVPAEVAAAPAATTLAEVRTERISAWFGPTCAVRDVSASFAAGSVTAIIGPSGCGKSTLLRTLNRLHETQRGARIDGRVWIDASNIYDPSVSAVAVRRQVALVMQRPTPFPTLTIAENVVAGLRAQGALSTGQAMEIAERALRRTALWSEVVHRLHANPLTLSEGQQQRLCIARALATAPRVLLLDEPTASLDPQSVQRIEELVYELRSHLTVIIVTHNMQQAARVSDRTAFLLHGELVELAPTSELFTAPRDPRTEAYITGRFG